MAKVAGGAEILPENIVTQMFLEMYTGGMTTAPAQLHM
jgi:hypothetical protein